MLGNQPLSSVPLSSFEDSEPLVFSPTDIILWPINAGTDICLYDPAEFDDCTPVVPPTPPRGPGGGMVIWRGPKQKTQKFPWEKVKTLSPTRRQPLPESKSNLVKRQQADDLEVVRILAAFLGHN